MNPRLFGALPALVLLCASTALAGNVSSGERLFESRCATCHTAHAPGEKVVTTSAVKRVTGAPDLGKLSRTIKGERLRAWLRSPWKLDPKTACDIRGLSKAQEESLMVFVLSRAKPVPAAESVRFKERLAKKVAERKAQHRPLPAETDVKRPMTGTNRKGAR